MDIEVGDEIVVLRGEDEARERSVDGEGVEKVARSVDGEGVEKVARNVEVSVAELWTVECVKGDETGSEEKTNIESDDVVMEVSKGVLERGRSGGKERDDVSASPEELVRGREVIAVPGVEREGVGSSGRGWSVGLEEDSDVRRCGGVDVSSRRDEERPMGLDEMYCCIIGDSKNMVDRDGTTVSVEEIENYNTPCARMYNKYMYIPCQMDLC